jgi:hypothetical protein
MPKKEASAKYLNTAKIGLFVFCLFAVSAALTSCSSSSPDTKTPIPPSGLDRSGLVGFLSQFYSPNEVNGLLNYFESQVSDFNLNCDYKSTDGSPLITSTKGRGTRSNKINVVCEKDQEKDVRMSPGSDNQNVGFFEKNPGDKKHETFEVVLPGEGSFNISVSGSLCQTQFTTPSGDFFTVADNTICRTKSVNSTVIEDVTAPSLSPGVSITNAQIILDMAVNDGTAGIGDPIIRAQSNYEQEQTLAVVDGHTRFITLPQVGNNELSIKVCDALNNCQTTTGNVFYEPVHDILSEVTTLENNTLQVKIFVPDPEGNIVFDGTTFKAKQETFLAGMIFPTSTDCQVTSVQGSFVTATCKLPKFNRKTTIEVSFTDKAGNNIKKTTETKLPAIPKAQREAVYGGLLAGVSFLVWRGKKRGEIKRTQQREELFQTYIAQNDLDNAFDILIHGKLEEKFSRMFEQRVVSDLVFQLISTSQP